MGCPIIKKNSIEFQFMHEHALQQIDSLMLSNSPYANDMNKPREAGKKRSVDK